MRKAYLFNETWEQALMNEVTTGPDSFTYEGLKSNGVCIAYAVAVDQEGQVCSEPSILEWKTYETELSGNVIGYNIKEVGADFCKIEWTATTEDPYCVVYAPTERFKGMSYDERKDLIISLFGKDLIYTGTNEMLQTYLNPNTSYTFVAFGWNGVDMTTDKMTEVVITTKAPSDPSTLTFEFEISNLTYKTVTVSCKGTPKDAGFIFGLASAKATDADVKKDLEDFATGTYGKGHDGWMQFLANFVSRGQRSSGYQVFQNLEYKPYAIGINETDGSYATEMIFGEVFKAPDGVRSDADIDIVWDKYYDVDEVYEAYPDLVDTDYIGMGMALLPCQTIVKTKQPDVNPDNHFFTYTALFDESCELLNDDELIYYISNISSVFRYNEKYIKYDKKYWLVAVAQEFGYNYTKLVRKEVNLSKAGVSPLGDFKPLGDHDPVSAAMSFDFRSNTNPFFSSMFAIAKGVDTEKVDRIMNENVRTAGSEQSNRNITVAPAQNITKMGAASKRMEKSLNAAEKALLK